MKRRSDRAVRKVEVFRSLLFCPATRPERFAKAVTSGADIVCIDLEDSVAPGRKAEARRNALTYFAGQQHTSATRILRINSPRGAEGLHDLVALVEAPRLPDGLMLPKVVSGEEVRWIGDLLPDPVLIPMIETPQALAEVAAIAGASDRVRAVAFGSWDYAAEVGSDTSWDALLYARGRLASAAAAQGIVALDGVWVGLDDEAGLRAEATRVAALGFGGKLAIHPRQIPVIHGAFNPSPTDIAWARKVVEAFANAADGVVVVDGRMVDAPLVLAARRTLATAARMKAG
ncbi:MAG: HpcH/HpaI aldolase/citrate lyase family protein [Alphaproteobacteria bacterium]